MQINNQDKNKLSFAIDSKIDIKGYKLKSEGNIINFGYKNNQKLMHSLKLSPNAEPQCDAENVKISITPTDY